MKHLKDLLFILVFVGIFQAFAQSSMRTGSLPELPAKTIAGLDTLQLLKEKPTFIYFWGEWCGICSSIQGTISSVLEDYSGVTVALRSGNKAQVSAYLQQNNLSWQVLNDADGSLAEAFGVGAVPAIFIITEDGQISSVSRGYITELGLRVRLWWAGVNF